MPAMCTQVLWKRLSLPCKDSRGTDLGHGGCSVVMSAEDVARAPTHLGTERCDRLDEHSGLEGNVRRAIDVHTHAVF